MMVLKIAMFINLCVSMLMNTPRPGNQKPYIVMRLNCLILIVHQKSYIFFWIHISFQIQQILLQCKKSLCTQRCAYNYQVIFQLFHTCNNRRHETALFQNIFTFCTLLTKFSNILPFFAHYLKNHTSSMALRCEFFSEKNM